MLFYVQMRWNYQGQILQDQLWDLEAQEGLHGVEGIHLDYQSPSNGCTPLHDALWHGFADCAEALVDAGARTDLVAWDGKQPVDLAAEKLGPDHPLTRRLPGMAAVA